MNINKIHNITTGVLPNFTINELECKHTEWIKFYPKDCMIHHKHCSNDPDNKNYQHKNNTISIKVCMNCGKILEVKDYGG